VGCTCAQAAARAPMPAGSHRRQPAPGAGASAGGGAAACCLPCAGSGTVPAVADGSTCALAPLPPNGAGAGSGAAGARGAGAELGSCVAPRSVSTRHAVSSVCTGGHCTRGNAAAHYVFLVPLALETLNDGSFVALRHLNSSKVAAPALVGLKVERPARRAHWRLFKLPENLAGCAPPWRPCGAVQQHCSTSGWGALKRLVRSHAPPACRSRALWLSGCSTQLALRAGNEGWDIWKQGRQRGLSNPGGNTHGLAAAPSTLRDDGQPVPPLLISVSVQQPVALAGAAARQQ